MTWWLRRILGVVTGGLFWKIEDHFIVRRTRRLAREDAEHPVTVSHPALGDFWQQRQQGWYRREIDWGGKPAKVTLIGGDALQRQLDDAAAFFARGDEMRRRILACAIAGVPELIEGWQLPGDSVAALERLDLSDDLWFDGEGEFQVHFTHPGDAYPSWISVCGTVEGGPGSAMIEG
jgi:hypothetical protein